MFRRLPPFGGDQRAVAEIVNGIMDGKTNNIGTVTLATGGATSTTITDARIGADSVILLTAADDISAAYRFPHGSFQDTTTQTIASTTTAYPMTFNTTDFADFVSIVSNSRITVALSGVYNLQFSGQFNNANTAIQDIDIWIRKNGTDVPLSKGRVSIPNSHGGVDGHLLPSWNYLLELNANDYVQIVWAATSTDVSMAAISAGTAPTTPAAASVIATVTHISCDAFTSNLYTLPYVSATTAGSATITHPANSISGMTYKYIIVG